jgi:outer membrane protein OmpA-like peptidoglycan-associated protein
MKKDNDNEERLIEFLVTIGSLVFFAFLSMYAMRGCDSDMAGNQGDLVATATATAATTSAVTDESRNLLVDANESISEDVNSVMDKDVDRGSEEGLPLATNKDLDVVADDVNATANNDKNRTTEDDANATTDVKSTADSKNSQDSKAGRKSEAEEEAGIISDIENERVSSHPYILKGIYFKSGSSLLSKKSKRQLDVIAKRLTEHKDVKVTLRGHTDSKGSQKENQILSLERASSVGMALVERGVNIDNIWIDGMGESEPIAINGTAKEMLRNRRVDIAVTK